MSTGVQKSQLMQLLTDPATKPAQIIKNEQTEQNCVSLYMQIHGIKNKEVAAAFYKAEQHHFLKLVNDNPNIAQCTPLSLYGVFTDVHVMGLSFDPTMKHLYIVPYNVNVGTKQAPKWEKRAALQIGGQGELVLRMNQGQVKHVDNPVIVFEGDEFKYGTKNGVFFLDHVVTLPRRSTKMLACYLKIVRPDGTTDYKVLTTEDLDQLRKFSKDPNSTAWTTGVAGMFTAKTIKHAFKNYPKLRVGKFSKEQEIEDIPIEIDYGIDISHSVEVIEDVAETTEDPAPDPTITDVPEF